jgi:hypothetical protein
MSDILFIFYANINLVRLFLVHFLLLYNNNKLSDVDRLAEDYIESILF